MFLYFELVIHRACFFITFLFLLRSSRHLVVNRFKYCHGILNNLVYATSQSTKASITHKSIGRSFAKKKVLDLFSTIVTVCQSLPDTASQLGQQTGNLNVDTNPWGTVTGTARIVKPILWVSQLTSYKHYEINSYDHCFLIFPIICMYVYLAYLFIKRTPFGRNSSHEYSSSAPIA